jgi:hypothetical protein
MCFAVYLASGKPLQSTYWNKAIPAFYIEGVPDDHVVRRQFSQPYVYYAGSHQGCGCGFLKDGEANLDLQRSQADYMSLSATVREAVSSGTSSEVFACWEGDQNQQPEHIDSVTPREMNEQSFQLKERQLLHVRPDA